MLAIVENKKKRKRPVAKDWPPTSMQRKTLLPYTKRIKLPRLDEAPYKELWIRIIRFALVDSKYAYRSCCRKMRYFRDVHYELRKATAALLNDSCQNRSLRIRREYVGRIVVDLSEARSALELLWLPYESKPNMEILVWVHSLHRRITHFSKKFPRTKYAEREVTHFSRVLPRAILRFTDISKWDSFINSRLKF